MILPFKSDLEMDQKPYATFCLIGLNVAIHLMTDTLKPLELELFYHNWGFSAFEFSVLRIITSMFLHGGYAHLLGNMLFLWVYGPGVERILTAAGFVAYYIFFGVAATLLHWTSMAAFDIDQPLIGASGAISGVMGAFFVVFPRSSIWHCLIVFPKFQFKLPAWLVLGYWFVLQWHNASHDDMSGVAFYAHIGGFLAGFVVTTYLKFGGDFRRAFSKTKAHQAIDEASNLPDDLDPRVGMTTVKEELDKSPDNPNLKYWYVVLARRAGRPESGDKYIESILPCIAEEDAKGRFNGYLIYSSRRAIDSPDAAMEFGRLLEANGHVQVACDVTEDYLQRHPNVPRPEKYRFRLAELMVKLNRKDRAKELFQEIANGDKKDPLVQAAEFELKAMSAAG